MPSPHAVLTDHQLTDALNYLLGLPIKQIPSGGLVRRDPISPCFTKVLPWRRKYHLERWMEHVMMSHGILPTPKGQDNSGRRSTAPPEVRRFIPPFPLMNCGRTLSY